MIFKVYLGLLDQLEKVIENENHLKIKDYLDDYKILDEYGIFEQFDYSENPKKYHYQYAELHLNPQKDSVNWELGEYLLIIYKSVAFEVFKVNKTEIRIVKNFKPVDISKLSFEYLNPRADDFLKYLKIFSDENK